MFAEYIGLLPDAMFTHMLEHPRRRPEEFATLARGLFGAMSLGGRGLSAPFPRSARPTYDARARTSPSAGNRKKSDVPSVLAKC